MIVLKFGGSSVADAACMRQVAELAKAALPDAPLVVLSAMGKTTNGLFAAAKAAEAGDLAGAMEQQRLLMAAHRKAALDLFGEAVPEDLLASGQDGQHRRAQRRGGRHPHSVSPCHPRDCRRSARRGQTPRTRRRSPFWRQNR